MRSTRLRSRRLSLVAASVVVIGLTACGSDADRESSDVSTAAPVTTEAPASTAPAATVPAAAEPPVIHVGEVLTNSVGATPAAGDSIAEGEMSDSKMMAANLEYVFDGQVTDDLTSPATAWYFAGPGEPVADETLAALAAQLGVDGPVEAIGADLGGGKMVGPDDFSGPSVTAGVDAMQSWWYSLGGDPGAMTFCEVSSEDTAADGTPNEVCTPEPPAGVPTEAEAEAATTDLMTRLGVDVASFEFETYADEWSSSVNAYLVLDGVRSNVSMYFSFGAEGALTWAGGYFATPQRGADYPRIGVNAAIERLNQPYWLSGDVLATKAVEEPAAESEEPIEDTTPADTGVVTEPAEPVNGDIPADTGAADDPVLVDPMPCDPAADCVPVDMEPIVIHVTNPQPSLEQLWADDGTIWLLPGYTFDSADEGVYSVIAVDDAYLVTSNPEPTPDPTIDSVPIPVPDTAVAPTDVPQTGSADPVPPQTTLVFPNPADFTGLPLDEAAKVVEQFGWVMRVIREDGQDLAVTDDFRENRLNVAVVDGLVTELVSTG